jgi:hypothetical protein
MPRKTKVQRDTCPVALDGGHRWIEPKRAYPAEQLTLGFAQCAACGAVLWKSSGHIERGLYEGDRQH